MFLKRSRLVLMKKPFHLFIVIAISSIVALLTYLLVQYTLQFTVQRVELLGHFPANSKITISNIQSNGYTEYLDDFEVVGDETQLQRVGTGYINKQIETLKIEIEQDSDAVVKLSRIRVFLPYLEIYYFDRDNVGKYFSSPQSMSDNDRHYQGQKISIEAISGSLYKPENLMSLALGVFFFFGCFCLLKTIQWSRIPAFSDMRLGRELSSDGEFDCINGIRGLAAILVLMSHTAPGFESVEMGIAILFVISGFLLSKPFVLDQQRIFNLATIQQFIAKRIKRILPMYYVYVFLLFAASFEFQSLVRHLLFLQGDGHLWPMTQIFIFYMILPFILIVTSLAHKIHRVVPVVILAIACYLAVTQLDGWEPFYNGRYSKEFFLYSFLLGVLAAYIQYDWIKRITVKSNITITTIGVLALAITLLSILWSAPMKPANIIGTWISFFWVKSILASCIIVLTLNSTTSIFQKIIANKVFRSVGIVGFSFYLLHGIGMGIFTEIQKLYFVDPSIAGERSWIFLIGSFCLTYPLAVFTYSYIERPFFGKRFNR